MTAPRFQPGDRVVCHICPDVAWTVLFYVDSSHLRFRLAFGDMRLTAPGEAFVSAPEGWRDIPVRPFNHIDTHGMTAKEITDALRPTAEQRWATKQWNADFERWHRDHCQPLLDKLAFEEPVT